MRLLEVVVVPKGYFATPLEGDTLFGHFCNQVALDSSLVKGGIEGLVETYDRSPVAVFSSPIASLAGESFIPAPTIPFSFLHGLQETAPKAGAVPNVAVPALVDVAGRSPQSASEGDLPRLSDDPQPGLGSRQAAVSYEAQVSFRGEISSTWLISVALERGLLAHPSRLHPGIPTRRRGFEPPLGAVNSGGTPTGEARRIRWWYNERVQWSILTCFDDTATDASAIVAALNRIGEWGYGGDASIGCGRFRVGAVKERELAPVLPGMWFVTLAPALPTGTEAKHLFFEPIIRHGRHGSLAGSASGMDKSRVRLAKTSAVGQYIGEARCRGIVGRGLCRGISSAHGGRTLHQAYAPVLPFIRGD